MKNDTTQLIGVRELAKQLSISVSKCYDLTARGELPSFKLGRLIKFDPNEVLEFLRAQREENCNPNVAVEGGFE